MRVLVVYNEPLGSAADPGFASEAGVLDSVSAVRSALGEAGHEVRLLGIGRRLDDALAGLRAEPPPDLVYNLCESVGGCATGEAWLAGILELLELPYTGSPASALSLGLHKARTKWLLRGAGLPTPEFVLVRAGTPARDRDRALGELLARGPVIVKPAAQDGSLGIDSSSVVDGLAALRERVEATATRFGDVLVERFVPGRELNVGVIESPEPRTLPIAEIEFHPDPSLPWPILSYDAKWDEGSSACRSTPPRCPARVEPALARELERVALAAFELLGCRDYARFDFRVGPDGEPQLLEVNTNPDIGPSAGLARMLRVDGTKHAEFLRQVAERAAARRPGRRDALVGAPSRPTSTRAGAAPGVVLRELRARDKEALVALTRATGRFREDEIEIAGEVIGEALRDGAGGHYQVLVAERDGRAVGWSAHGRVPLTDAAYDLYWIAVDTGLQSRGIGRTLLAEVERRLRDAGARWVLAETSTTEAYGATRAFYLRSGYAVVGQVAEFYRPGDGRVTFGKRLDGR